MTRTSPRPRVAGERPRAWPLWIAAAVGTLLYAAVAVWLAAPDPGPARWAALGGGSAVLAAGWWCAPRSPPRAGLLAIVAGAVLFRALLLPAPLGSDDVYRYLWDGRVQAAGVNPYRYAPADPALAPLRDEAVWPELNRREVPTVYPPAAQAVFLVAWTLGLRGVTGFKALVVAGDLAALGLLVAVLRRSGRDPRAAVAYAWNPAVLLSFAHAGHLDAFVVAALLAAVLAAQRDRALAAGALVGLAASLKLYPLVVLPAFLGGPDGRWRWRRAAGVAAVAVGVLAVGYLPYLPGSGLSGGVGPPGPPGGALGWLGGYLDAEGYTTGRRFLLLRPLGAWAPMAAAAALAAVGLLAARSERPPATRAAWLLAAALIVVTPVQSWYTASLVALAVAGGAGWLWPWLAVAYEASYVSVFFGPEDRRVSVPIRRAAALAAATAVLAATRFASARRAALWQPPHPPPPGAGDGPAGSDAAPDSLADVCVVLPALDEADALPAALAGRPAGPRYVVVDNGSRDGTAAVARALGVEVVHEPRRGFGAACLAGVDAAGRAGVVVFVDADATFDWNDLDALVAPVARGGADLVLGRRRRGLREPGAMPWHVAAANRALAAACGPLAGVRLHDIGPFRAIRRDALLGLGMRERTYGWPLEMVLRAGRAGLRVAEVDVRYRIRAGRSKVTGRPWPTVKATVRMGVVLARHATGRTPPPRPSAHAAGHGGRSGRA